MTTVQPVPAFLDRLLPADAAADVTMLGLKLVELLNTWEVDYGEPFRPRYNNIFCFSTAFTAPWLSVDALHIVTKICAWITALDDAADELYTYDALRGSVDRCRKVLDGQPSDPDDPLAVVLAEIRDALAGYPGFVHLGPLWRETTDRLMVAMEFERRAADSWHAGGSPPDLTEYLEHATESVGIPMLHVALWLMMDGTDLPADPRDLLPAMRDCALVVRLANDLRGQAREKAHGNLNAIVLGMTPEQAMQAIQTHAGDCRRKLQGLIQFGSAIALNRQTAWSVRLYGKIDFRTPGIWPEGSIE